MAQQGSILVFVVLILLYIRLMDKLDAQYGENAKGETPSASGASLEEKEA
jgi:uncharacterized membrane protein